MSDLFRQHVNGAPPPRPKPNPISILEEPVDDHPPSDSSSSSADSLASVNTVRPSSREQPPPSSHWTNYFAQELYLEQNDSNQTARYHVYLTPPLDPKKDPLFICHHGAGSSGLSFAIFAQKLKLHLPSAGILSLEARAHGSSVVTKPSDPDFSIATLASDAMTMINLTRTHLSWPSLPPTILIGHSLGGAVVTHIAASNNLGNSLVGFCVLDVVEGSAVKALGHMQAYLSSRPSSFASLDEAITWHTRTRTIRNSESAQISVPSLFTLSEEGRYVWHTDLSATPSWWPNWFNGMSSKFLQGRGAKMLMLAGTDRLDKELMIGQMQGKFQLVVLPDAGHFIQEDVPERTAELVAEFWRRNDRSGLVLPPKVSDLIAQGKKV